VYAFVRAGADDRDERGAGGGRQARPSRAYGRVLARRVEDRRAPGAKLPVGECGEQFAAEAHEVVVVAHAERRERAEEPVEREDREVERGTDAFGDGGLAAAGYAAEHDERGVLRGRHLQAGEVGGQARREVVGDPALRVRQCDPVRRCRLHLHVRHP
jgi:hypothetical protein